MVAGAILFPGQGAQVLGMGLDVATASGAARELFEQARDVLGTDLAEIIGGDDAQRLDRTDVCQPAILVTSLAVMAALEERDLLARDRVTGVAGLSLGEYTALTWAGALEPTEAMRLVAARGAAMQHASELHPSGMLSLVGATAESAAAVCAAARGDDVLVVANLLAPGQVAIAGSNAALERASGLLRDHKIRKGVRLSVAGAFHSPCMEPAAATLSEALDAATVSAPRVPVVMNVSAEPTTDPEVIREGLRRQVTSPVLWQASMEALLASGCASFLEPAPGKQLTNMLRRYDGDTTAATCATADELVGFTPWPGADA